MTDTWNNDFSVGSRPTWFPWEGRSPRIILSSSCVFRRNLDGMLFPPFGGDLSIACCVMEKLDEVLSKHPEYGFVHRVQPQELTPMMRSVFDFNRMGSREYLSLSVGRKIAFTADRMRVCRINDRNHLTIQQTAEGLQLDSLVQELNGMLSVLGMDVPFARDKYFGYLCTNPEYCGTGFSAHVTMNLPGIIFRHFEEQAVTAAQEMGFTLQYDKPGNGFISQLVVVSAFNLPRCSPQEIAVRLTDFIKRLERHELDARQVLLSDATETLRLKDLAARAYSLLRSAVLLNAYETVNAMGMLWAADELGIRPLGIPQTVFFKLYTTTLCQLRVEMEKGKVNAPVSVQASRAKAVQKIFAQCN